MLVSGNPLGTQKPYLRALRDLMETEKRIPESLTADQIKAHLSSLQPKISSSALNLRVCGILYDFVGRYADPIGEAVGKETSR